MKTGVLTIVAFALTYAPALASDRGSVEDQLACTPDVYRLCSQLIPDEDAIVGCLKKNVAILSPGCHKVFSAPSHANSNNNGDNGDD